MHKLLLSLACMSMTAFADLSTRLEQAIYQEETAGDLQQAINVYTEIIATQANDTIIAEAYFRLAQCEQKLGNTAAAKKYFNKVITAYAEQKALYTMAQAALAELENAPLELLASPWENRETLSYKLSTPSGGSMGAIEYIARELKPGAWRLQSYTAFIVSNTLQYTQVDTDPQFTALASQVNSSALGQAQARFSPKEVSIESLIEGKASQQKLPATTRLYDNEQILYLLRRLPLAENYHTTFNVMSSLSGSILPARLKVEASETITTDLGSFETYRVKLKLPPTAYASESQTFWVAKTAARQVVKFRDKLLTMELQASSSQNENASVVDPQVNLHFTLPQLWRNLSVDSPDPSMNMFQYLLPASMDIHGMFVAKYANFKAMPGVTIEQVVQGDIHALESMLSGYRLIAEPSIIHVGQLKAQQFTGEYLEGDVKKHEYRAYILGDKGVYWFIFRGDAEKLKPYQSEIHEMITHFQAD